MSHNLESQVRGFIDLLLGPARPSAEGEYVLGSMSRRIPSSLLSPEAESQGRIHLGLQGAQYLAYRRLLHALREHGRSEHLDAQSLESELWQLRCDVVLNSDAFHDQLARQGAARQLLARCCPPRREFEVIIAINDLDVGDEVVIICGCVLVRAGQWLMRSCARPRVDPHMRQFLGRTVLILAESGTNADAVAGRGRQKAEELLHVLRVYLPTTLTVHDHQLWFALDRATFVRECTNPLAGAFYYTNQDRPIPLEWHRGLDEAVDLANDHFTKLQAFPPKLREDLERAFHWVGVAAVERDLDRRMIALCIALEAILAMKNDRRKGEAISRRMALLFMRANRPLPHPSGLLLRYEGRSVVVHGTGLDVASEEDYGDLRSAATEVLCLFIDFAQGQERRRRPQLLKALDQRRDLLKLAAWLEDAFPGDPNSVALVKDIRLLTSPLRRVWRAVIALGVTLKTELRGQLPGA